MVSTCGRSLPLQMCYPDLQRPVPPRNSDLWVTWPVGGPDSCSPLPRIQFGRWIYRGAPPKARQHQHPKVPHQEDLMEVQCPRQHTSTGANGCAHSKPLDRWTEFFFFYFYLIFPFIFYGHFLIIYFIYFPMVHSFRGGGCKDPLQPHA